MTKAQHRAYTVRSNMPRVKASPAIVLQLEPISHDSSYFYIGTRDGHDPFAL
jgi:hypothetical protein